MAELKIYLSDSLNERFRRIAMSIFGYGRGSLSKAAEEALTKWCSEHDHSTVEKAVGISETVDNHPSEEAGTRINPDERENVDPLAKELGGDSSLNPIGPTA